MKTDLLRQTYIDFFKTRGHKHIPSDSLVPVDPSVLFTSAGMNQFKAYFLGEKKDMSRACSCQKCLRTGDLDNVGATAFHHTFFEMLGNFSFGDYFKKEAIEWAWEFLTGTLNLKDKDLWISVYAEDDEAYSIWQKHIGIPENKLVRLGAHSNFWPADAPELGPNGPCGPCSEIFFDKGENIGCGKKTCNPDCDCGRFVEIWNLVFTQFNRTGYNQLDCLGQQNIDTGMGLERMASVLQGKDSNFGIDILSPVVEYVRGKLRVDLKQPMAKKYLHAIVDHVRAASFSICDGVFPSNEDRGYVIRRLIRKAAYHAYVLGRKKAFLYSLVPLYADLMKTPYPELADKKEDISAVIKAEEEKFLATFESGKSQLMVLLDKARREQSPVLKGEDVFKLYDTYGFPLDTVKDLAGEENIAVEEDRFNELLEERKELSRRKSMFDSEIFAKSGLEVSQQTEFIGYDNLRGTATITALFREEKSVPSLSPGDQGGIILDKTPFYAESGGQKEDKGKIVIDNGEFQVEHVLKIKDAVLHTGRMVRGTMQSGDKAEAVVDRDRRQGLMRAHTATHLLQAALRAVLGTHVTQQGSLVDADRLRFDFTHFKGLTVQELARVEELVNQYILRGDPVEKRVLAYEDAKKEKALAFFEEKYSDLVRVVSMGEYSKEFCGGTHVDNTMEIGSFCVLAEYSVSSGIRRIEALVGEEAYKRFAGYKDLISQTSELLKAKDEEIISRIGGLQSELRQEKDRADSLEKEILAFQVQGLIDKNQQNIGGIRTIVLALTDKNFSHLLYLSDLLREKLGSGLILLVSQNNDSSIFVFSLTKDLEKKKISVKDFVARYKDDLGLRGGGRPSLCQGQITGIKDSSGYARKLIETIREYVETCVS